ncbi:MAG: hypothetical protein RL621_972 [Bacteroidota bacterium]|jgi:hypothetical protein
MNNNIKQLADQALVSTQWTVVKSLSTEQVNRELELDAFAKLLLDDCMNLCDKVSLEQNKRFAPIIHTFVQSFKDAIKERYTE